jgi:phospholipid/cholesterol/gamma-HCH transport system ATP-binding protein
MAKPEESAHIAIRVTNLKKTFDGKEMVLNGLSIDIPKGEVVALIGFSGTGKSVLLKTILGLLKPTEGSVQILDQDISSFSPKQMASVRQRFGVLFQNAALFDDMTAVENVVFPIYEHRRKQTTPAERIEIAKKKLIQVGIIEKDFNKVPSQLSGGMRKRVGLARALALDPEILFYDEPTTGLDPITSEVVDNLILETHRHREGLTSVVVTHDLAAAFRIGDHVAMLYKGGILMYGTPQEFLDSKDEVIMKFVSKGVHRT